MREGWEPRKAETVKGQSCFRRLIMVSGQVVWHRGMLLCEMPKEKYKSMKAYYNEKALNKTIFGRRFGCFRT